MTRQTIGWIGAGKMGGPMSRRLVEAQHRVIVLDPDEQSRALAAAAGAEIADDLRRLATTADIVFSMIPNDAVLDHIVCSPDGLAAHMSAGSVLVDTSTVSPATSRAVAECLAARGIQYVRAPVSGSTALADAGTLSVMASGPRAAYERVEALLATFSARRFYLGDGEQARYLKLVVNTLVGATSSLLAEALAFGRKGGLSDQAMLDVITQSAVASPLIGYKRDMIVSGDFTPAFTVEQMMKDLDLIMGTARTDHVPMFLAALVRQQYEAAYADGRAQRDFFVLCQPAAEAETVPAA